MQELNRRGRFATNRAIAQLESFQNRRSFSRLYCCDPGRSEIFATSIDQSYSIARIAKPLSGALWTVVNERDELGPDLVPDYLTSGKDGGFYGLAVQLLRAALGSASQNRSGRTWWRTQ